MADNDDPQKLYEDLRAVYERADTLLNAHSAHARYQSLLRQHADAERHGTPEEIAALKAQLDAYGTAPPTVTDNDLIAHYTRKADVLRALAKHGVPQSAEALAETEQHLAHLSTVDVEIITFGYLHSDNTPPPAHLVVDLRQHFRDPHVREDLRELTARDETVYRLVMNTPGIAEVIEGVERMVRGYRSGPSAADCGPLRIAIGCADGRHRSAAVGMALHSRFTNTLGLRVRLHHRDIDKPVKNR